MDYFVYILKSQKNGSYYIGHTHDLEQRIKKHNSGQSPYTKQYRPWDLIYSEKYETKTDASHREREIKKKKSRKYIEKLIAGKVG